MKKDSPKMRSIPLSRGLWAIVDEADYARVSRYLWYSHKAANGIYYAARSAVLPKKGTILLHRFIMNAPPGKLVDHRDGNGLNNTRENLRIATASENGRNSYRHRNGTALLGVTKHKSGKYQAQRWGKYIGSFDTKEEAHRAFLKYDKEHPL